MLCRALLCVGLLCLLEVVHQADVAKESCSMTFFMHTNHVDKSPTLKRFIATCQFVSLFVREMLTIAFESFYSHTKGFPFSHAFCKPCMISNFLCQNNFCLVSSKLKFLSDQMGLTWKRVCVWGGYHWTEVANAWS